jgi:hypothetical protein
MLLNEGRFVVGYLDETKEILCRVTFDLTREHHVLVDCMESLHELISAPSILSPRPEQTFRITSSETTKPVDCHIWGSFEQQIIGDDPSLFLTLRPFGNNAFLDNGSKLAKVAGEVANFNKHKLGVDRTIRLDDGIWKFELAPVEEPSSYPAEIQNQSYSFSHHLLLQRADGRSFLWSEAQPPLEMLSTFLSFCSERWIAPTLLKGYDESGKLAVQDWRAARIDPAGSRPNWLDEYDSSAMAKVFPRFAHLMEHADWKETIRTAVYWYVRGNTNYVGPDGAIVLVQTALERLAWHFLVRVRHSISARDFGDLPAAGQLRLVLDSCCVPLDLPSNLSELTKVAVGQKGEQDWVDGPQTFVAVRNQIVHPGKQKRVKGGRAFYEALQLGKWYVELLLLRAFGFEGSYACRLNIPMCVGSVEPVPWAQPRT